MSGRKDKTCSRCNNPLDGAHRSYCLACQRARRSRFARPKPPLVHNRTGYVRGCRCHVCIRANRDYQRWYAKADLPSEVPHGTVARYRRGCRCDECFEARQLWRMFQYPLSIEELRSGWSISLQVAGAIGGNEHLTEWSDPTGDEALSRLSSSPVWDLCVVCGLSSSECLDNARGVAQ